MDLTSVAFPASWIVATWALAAPLAWWALRAAPWGRFGASEQAHVWYGTIFCLIVLWNIQATVGEGYTFHLLGVAAFTLLVGAPLALIGTVVAVGVNVAVRGGFVVNVALVWLTMAVAPVAVVTLVRRLSEQLLPPNFFIYIFVVAFFGAAVSLGSAGLAGAIALATGGGRPAGLVFGEYVPYLIYLAFGEATLTGMALTLTVVYRPQWVASFDDARYIRGQ